MKRLLVLWIVAGCGRVGFDAHLADANPPPTCERHGYPNVPWLVDGRYSDDVALVDLDGDGHLDIVTLSRVGMTVMTVRRGVGDGTFGPEVSYPSAVAPTGLKVADLDGDGIPDVAAVARTGATISIWWGTGHAVFAAEQMLPTAAGASDIVLADVDGDGALDLIVAEGAGVTVHHNMGARTFDAGTETPLGAAQDRVAVGNLDGDTQPDIISVSSAANAFWVVNGASSRKVSTNPMFGFTVVGVADLDKDGRDEVVLADLGVTLAVIHNHGDGTFDPEVDYTTNGDVGFDFAFGDVNRDGRVDILLADQGEDIVSLFLNQGDGTFVLHDLHAGAQTASIALGDVDGDGKLDLVSTIFRGVSVVLGAGDLFDQPVEYPGPSNATGSFVADLDGDGHLDVLIGGMSASTIWFGVGDGTMTGRTDVAGLGYVVGPVPIDVDGDGRFDVVGATTSDAVVVRNLGGRAFSPPATYAAGTPGIMGIAGGDFDGDGKPELVATTPTDVVLFANHGDGTFDPATSIVPLSAQAFSIVTGDFDHDGKRDLAYATNTPNTITVLRGNGDRTFQPPSTFATSGAGSTLLVADVDEDGLDDLVVKTGAMVTVLRLDLAGVVVAGPQSAIDDFAELTTVARIGSHVALVGANQTMNSINIYDGRGDGTFGPGRQYLAGAYPAGAYAVDLDGKHGLDFVIPGFDRLSIAVDACGD